MNYIIKILGLLLLYFYCVDLIHVHHDREGFYQIRYGHMDQLRWTNGSKHQVMIFADEIVCIGTLLTMDSILTTCGCFNVEYDFTLTYVIAGSVRMDRHDNRLQYRDLKRIVCHHRYKILELGAHDVAIIQTTSPFDKSFRIKLAALPKSLRLNINNPPIIHVIGINGENTTITPYMFEYLMHLSHYAEHYKCACAENVTDHKIIVNSVGKVITRLICFTYFSAGHELWWAGNIKEPEPEHLGLFSRFYKWIKTATKKTIAFLLYPFYDLGFSYDEVQKLYKRVLGYYGFCGMVDGTAYMLDSTIIAIHHYNYPVDCVKNKEGLLEYSNDCLINGRTKNVRPAILQVFYYREWIMKRLLPPLRKPSLHQKNVNLNLKKTLPLVLYLTLLFIVCLIFLICNRAVLPSIHS